MRSKIHRAILLLLFVVQLAFPVGMIVRMEMINSGGELVKFEVEMVDPYDSFRGRYMSISIKSVKSLLLSASRFEMNQRVYARLSLDENGFGQIGDTLTERPENGLYIAGRAEKRAGKLFLKLPVTRYYMNEKYAPVAGKILEDIADGYREGKVYITVRVRRGRAVIQGMYISGVEIDELVRQEL